MRGSDQSEPTRGTSRRNQLVERLGGTNQWNQAAEPTSGTARRIRPPPRFADGWNPRSNAGCDFLGSAPFALGSVRRPLHSRPRLPGCACTDASRRAPGRGLHPEDRTSSPRTSLRNLAAETVGGTTRRNLGAEPPVGTSSVEPAARTSRRNLTSAEARLSAEVSVPRPLTLAGKSSLRSLAFRWRSGPVCRSDPGTDHHRGSPTTGTREAMPAAISSAPLLLLSARFDGRFTRDLGCLAVRLPTQAAAPRGFHPEDSNLPRTSPVEPSGGTTRRNLAAEP
jgi:hypothetical protein